MAEAGAPSNIKRRRISTDDDAQQGPNSLSDLPSGILAHAANFLAPPSRSLFAIAIDENSAASPNERSSAIVGNQWDVLDFGDIEKDLAAKLSDDYIERVLLCIDAVNKLKRLKLTNCVNITGAGLEPLRGSAIIEQIDLSLVGGNQSPLLSPEPPISCDDVLPILDSIIEREGCALKYIQFPHVWCKRENASAHSEFHAFIARYNEMWTSRGAISCLGCNRSLPRHGEPWIRTELFYYGTQRYTCYDCLKHYCDDNLGSERERHVIRKCGICERDYCVDCMNTQLCPLCQGYTCIDATMNVKDAMKKRSACVGNVNVKIVAKYYVKSAIMLRVRRFCVLVTIAVSDTAIIVECKNYFDRGNRVAQDASKNASLCVSVCDCMKKWNG